uniref:Uncharacterized protein n=1 Tax=Haptolina brevifila TaxID=156173 RepID=A0A7S2MV79_9EUKA
MEDAQAHLRPRGAAREVCEDMSELQALLLSRVSAEQASDSGSGVASPSLPGTALPGAPLRRDSQRSLGEPSDTRRRSQRLTLLWWACLAVLCALAILGALHLQHAKSPQRVGSPQHGSSAAATAVRSGGSGSGGRGSGGASSDTCGRGRGSGSGHTAGEAHARRRRRVENERLERSWLHYRWFSMELS